MNYCYGNCVICIEGDGSIMMNLQELQTIVTNKLPIKIFIINNNGYHQKTSLSCLYFETINFDLST